MERHYTIFCLLVAAAVAFLLLDPPPEVPKEQKADLEILSSIIHAECGTCSTTEQYLVGSVVLNRVNDLRWAGSVESVVTSPGQFQGCLTNQYFPIKSTTRVAADLLNGLYITPGIYFFCLKDVTNPPMDSIIIEGGHHYFGI